MTAFERSLWAQFARLAEDPVARREAGVTAAGGQGVFFPANFDHLYTVTLQADGGPERQRGPAPGDLNRDALRAAQPNG